MAARQRCRAGGQAAHAAPLEHSLGKPGCPWSSTFKTQTRMEQATES